MKSFVIVAPSYTDCSSGVRSCYRLCHWLNTLGATAHMVAGPPAMPIPREWDVRFRLFERLPVPKDVIAIYPEIYQGNPIQAKHVVRWVLNFPGLLGGDKVYHPDEHVFYAPQTTGPDLFREAAEAAAGKEVYPLGPLSIHEPHYFYPTKRSDRKGTLYFVYKGFEAFTRSGPKFSIDYWRLLSPGNPVPRVELGRLFRECEAFYSWDPHSGIMRDAVMCGAPTYLVDADANVTEVPPVSWPEAVVQYFQPPAGIERLMEIAT